MEIGGRFNQHSMYGNNFTYHVNPYLYVRQQGKLFANYYSSFKAPSLYQLYSPYGNQDLNAERGQTFEIGYEQRIGQFYTRLVGFQQNVQEGIVFQSMDVEPYGRYENISKQKTKGLEFETRYVWKGFSAEVGYTYLDGNMQQRLNGKDTTYSSLIRRPRHQGSLRLNQTISKKWSSSFYVQYVGNRKDYYYDDASFQTKEVALSSYLWTEIQTSYALSSQWRIQLLWKNVLNQVPQELYGYSGQPTNLQVSLLGRF